MSVTTILGVDPGLDVTGYAVLRGRAGGRGAEVIEAGVVRTSSKDPLQARVREIFEQIRTILSEQPVDLVAVERLYVHYEHPRTAILMGHARGTILLASELAKVGTMDLSPAEVKRALTGSGKANKAQMQRAIARVFGWPKPPEPHDVCDAIAIALTALARADFLRSAPAHAGARSRRGAARR